jgi:hypothetical protein
MDRPSGLTDPRHAPLRRAGERLHRRRDHACVRRTAAAPAVARWLVLRLRLRACPRYFRRRPAAPEDRYVSARRVPAFIPAWVFVADTPGTRSERNAGCTRSWRVEGRNRRDHSRAYKTRTSARQPAGLGHPPRARRTDRLAGLSWPLAPSGTLRFRPQITLVKRGSRVRIPPSAWLSRAVCGLLPSRVGGARVQNAYISDPAHVGRVDDQ